MQTTLSSAPDAKYFPLGEKRTVWIVPEWLLIDASCFGLLAYSGSRALSMDSVDQIRTYPSEFHETEKVSKQSSPLDLFLSNSST